MTVETLVSRARLLVLLGFLGPSAAVAQGRGIDLTYGRWWNGALADVYAASYYRPFVGSFDYGLGLIHLNDSRSLVDRTQTGGDVSLSVGRGGGGLYVVAAAGLAMRHADRNVDGAWSAGAGYAWRPLSFLAIGLETRYRVEDRNVRGFWRLEPADRRGLVVLARVGLGSTGTPVPPTGRTPAPDFETPSATEVAHMGRSGGASDEVAWVAASVVQTAIDAMGTPYRWGGGGENGYDCSGLIQYAYGQHGVLLPRVSRDQARMGTLVDRDVHALMPGDILGFAEGGSGVTHVGLYVGDGLFIHSSSSGVKLSSLRGTDPDSRHWRQRWTVARRILN